MTTFIEAKEKERGDGYDVEEESFTLFVDEFPLKD